MSHLPSIGVVTTSTNSVSRGYVAFLACVDTWSKIADQMVIVDGGTDDDTYDVLKNWTNSSNYSVFYSPETYWDLHGRFHLAQWGINTRIGMEQLQTDWALIVPGDHILDTDTVAHVRQELVAHQDALALKFKRLRLRFGQQVLDYKFYVLNLKKIRAEGINVAWGFNKPNQSCPDDPILFDEETTFLDAVNGASKRHLGGLTLSIKERLDAITCWSYGFYFFTPQQVLAHLMDFYLCFNIRYYGRPIRPERWFMSKENLDKIVGFVSRDEELKKPHPREVLRLIENFYQPEMIGAAIYRLDDAYKKIIEAGHRFIDYGSTLRFLRSGFPSIVTRQKWSPLGQESEPLDLARLYKEQDAFLPPRLRSRGETL